MIRHYILVGREVMEVPLEQWAMNIESWNNRHIGDDTISGVRVSTIFLGLDHNFFERGPPLLFETMTFGPGPNDSEMIGRWYTIDEAEAEHNKLVALYRAMADALPTE